MRRSSTPRPVFPRHTAGTAWSKPPVLRRARSQSCLIVAIVAAAYSNTVPPTETATGGTAAPAEPGPAFQVTERPRKQPGTRDTRLHKSPARELGLDQL